MPVDYSKQYREQGFLVIENLFDQASLQPVRDAADSIVDQFDIRQHRSVFSTRDHDQGRDEYFMGSAQAVHCFLEQDALNANGDLVRDKHRAINKIGHAMHDLIPEFQTFCQQAIFANILKAIGYSEALLWQTMYIFKQPQIGGEVRWHQDASYLITKPASVVEFWIALDYATRKNGCLWLQPGGHRSALREIYQVDEQTRSRTSVNELLRNVE